MQGASRCLKGVTAAAKTNELVCWLGQGRGHKEGGHTESAPYFPRMLTMTRNGAGPQTVKRSSQTLHRVVVRALKGLDDFRSIIVGGPNVHASHLCHNPHCFNPEHLVVESGHKTRRNKTAQKLAFAGTPDRVRKARANSTRVTEEPPLRTCQRIQRRHQLQRLREGSKYGVK